MVHITSSHILSESTCLLQVRRDILTDILSFDFLPSHSGEEYKLIFGGLDRACQVVIQMGQQFGVPAIWCPLKQNKATQKTGPHNTEITE